MTSFSTWAMISSLINPRAYFLVLHGEHELLPPLVHLEVLETEQHLLRAEHHHADQHLQLVHVLPDRNETSKANL